MYHIYKNIDVLQRFYKIYLEINNLLAWVFGSSVRSIPNFLKIYESLSEIISDACSWHPLNLGICLIINSLNAFVWAWIERAIKTSFASNLLLNFLKLFDFNCWIGSITFFEITGKESSIFANFLRQFKSAAAVAVNCDDVLPVKTLPLFNSIAKQPTFVVSAFF